MKTNLRILVLLMAVSAAILLPIPTIAQRIAVLSDVHVIEGNANDANLREAVAEINASDFDAVVMNGDLTNEGSDEQLLYVKGILDGIRHPLYVLPGNHENNWSQSATTTFPRLWGDDRFSAVIDSLVIVGVNCGPYMKMGDGHVKTEDLEWLRKELFRRVRPGMKVISFCHYPLQREDLGGSAYKYYNYLCEFPVVLHVNGHYHSWKEYSIGDLPCVMVRALAMGRETKDYGYTILTVDKDSVRIDEKIIGADPVRKYDIPFPDKPLGSLIYSCGPGPDRPVREYRFSHKECDESVFTRMACDRDNAYFGTSKGRVIAIDKQSLDTKWTHQFDGAIFSRVTPLKKGKVAVAHTKGITILDAATGEVVADYPSKEGPYVADGLLSTKGDYIQGGYKRMECRDGKTGKLKWCFDSIGNYCQAAPVVDGNDVIFGAWDTWLRCLDRKNGKLKWKWSNGRTANMLGPGNVVPVVTKDRVIIVAPDRYMTALDRKTGRQIWRDNSHKYRESLGASEDGTRVYAKTMDGTLVAVDAESDAFHELWETDLGIGYEHAPCVVAERDGTIFVGTRGGQLVGVNAETHDIVFSVYLGSSEVNGIDIDPYDGSIWVSLVEGRIYHVCKTMSKPHRRR